MLVSWRVQHRVTDSLDSPGLPEVHSGAALALDDWPFDLKGQRVEKSQVTGTSKKKHQSFGFLSEMCVGGVPLYNLFIDHMILCQRCFWRVSYIANLNQIYTIYIYGFDGLGCMFVDAENDHDRTNGHGGVYHIMSERVCMLHAIQTPRKSNTMKKGGSVLMMINLAIKMVVRKSTYKKWWLDFQGKGI